MNWIQKYDKLVLRDYPFFYISIREVEKYGNKSYEGGHMFGFPRPKFHCLEDAKAHMETLLYKAFTKAQPLLELVEKFKDLEAIPHIYASYTEWCNNNGNGRYHPSGDCERWKRYHWIEGRFSITSSISKRYALRYDKTQGEDSVKNHAVVVIKRHINKFIREFK
jgi:hypothetical protein